MVKYGGRVKLMSEKRKNQIVYLIILILTTFILASNLLYNKIYYLQMAGVIVFSILAILLKRFIPFKIQIILSILCFIMIVVLSMKLYKVYASTVAKYCEDPLYIEPQNEFAAIKTEPNEIYYHDDSFKGLIGFNNDYIDIFNFYKKENQSIKVGSGDLNDNYSDTIIDVVYNKGLIYATKDNNHSGMTLSVIDVNTYQTVKSVSYDYVMRLLNLNNQVYATKDDVIYQVNSDLELLNAKTVTNGIFYGKQYNDVYLLERYINNQQGYELLVYHKDFEYVEKLLSSPNPMLISENNQGELFVSEQNGIDLYFDVYNTDLNLEHQYLIKQGDYSRNIEATLIDYDSRYYVKYYDLDDSFYFRYTNIFDSSFNKQNSCLFVDELWTIYENVFDIDNNIYITSFNKMYKMTEKDYFKSNPTLSVISPLSNNAFYLSVLVYPILLINIKKKKQ